MSIARRSLIGDGNRSCTNFISDNEWRFRGISCASFARRSWVSSRILRLGTIVADKDWLNWEIQVPDGSDWIEYMLNIPAQADVKERGVQNHFSLGVDKIQSAASQLHQSGLEKLDGPEIGRDGKWSLDVYDPDGTRVEVMEIHAC